MTALSPKTIYDELVKQGASTTQALGILANMFFESGFNPEAVGDNGSSFGLVQQHGAYSHLVTGNAQADMASQIKTMIGLGGLGAASGGSPAQSASNFAANYERCVGCQHGGSQNSSRTAYAATVAGWAASGKWPASAGSGTAGGSPGGSGGQQATNAGFNPFGWVVGAADKEFGWFGGLIRGVTGIPSTIGDVATSISGLVRAITKITDLFLMLFRPEFWLRVGAFVFAVLALAAGLYFFKEAL